MAVTTDPQGSRLPIKIDSTSNGEYAPIPLSEHQIKANNLAHKQASERAAYTGRSRRNFLVSACGAASTLLAFNEANAAIGNTDGYYAIDQLAAVDDDAAAEQVEGSEFIFDVQGHYVPPSVATDLRPLCNSKYTAPERDYMQCLGADSFIKDVFLDSDTDMMVLSFIPSTAEDEPLTIEEAAATRDIVDQMDGSHRLLLHGRVNPNQPGDVERMDELVERWGVSAFKCYTQWGPDGKGFWLSDEDTGIPFIEKALSLGVNNICVHKGIPFGRQSYEHSLCDDVGVVAKRFPDMNFLIYHSGYIPRQDEGAYDPDRGEGIDGLIKSVLDNNLGHDSNVYAELGSTWRMLMGNPGSAAHAIGKLVKHLGENNVVYGSDSIWYGSPQDQIQAFRTFQISETLQEEHGYPAMTPELRAKIFGLNATKPYGIGADEVKLRVRNDGISQRRLAYLEAPDPHFLTYGPRTRKQFLDLLRFSSGP